MAQKNKRQYDVTFVDINLTKAQSQALKTSEFTLNDMENSIAKLCESCYKVTLSFDVYSNHFAAFLIPTAADDVNSGMILTARGSTPVKAVKQLLYKHYEVAQGAWLNYANPRKVELDD